MDDIFVTQPFTARHVRYTKKLGFGSLGNSIIYFMAVPSGIFVDLCSKCGFGIIISEGIIDYALNVMLLVQYDSRRVVIVISWGDV